MTILKRLPPSSLLPRLWSRSSTGAVSLLQFQTEVKLKKNQGLSKFRSTGDMLFDLPLSPSPLVSITESQLWPTHIRGREPKSCCRSWRRCWNSVSFAPRGQSYSTGLFIWLKATKWLQSLNCLNITVWGNSNFFWSWKMFRSSKYTKKMIQMISRLGGIRSQTPFSFNNHSKLCLYFATHCFTFAWKL
jgi:hypothetical protein